MKRGSCYHRGNVQDEQLPVIPRSASYRLASVSSEGFLQPLAFADAAANLLLRHLQQEAATRGQNPADPRNTSAPTRLSHTNPDSS